MVLEFYGTEKYPVESRTVERKESRSCALPLFPKSWTLEQP